MLLNPYEIFGLSYKATLEEVRKAYYSLALLTHPDKGGDTNDMQVVNAAYAWIKKGIENADERSGMDMDYSDLIKEYTPLRNPTMDEIEGEVLGYPRSEFPSDDDFLYRIVIQSWLHEQDDVKSATTLPEYAIGKLQFYKTEHPVGGAGTGTFFASIPHGYADVIQETTNTETETVTVTEFKRHLVEYEEPQSCEAAKQHIATDVIIPEKLEDYTIDSAADLTYAFSALSDLGAEVSEKKIEE
jgi:hypothetical protein